MLGGNASMKAANLAGPGFAFQSNVVPNTKICSARPQLYKISTNVGAVVVFVMLIKF